MPHRTACLALVLAALPAFAADQKPKGPTTAEVIEQSKPSDWRALDPENTLYLDLASGRVVIELAPAFAPAHAANLRTLAREGYFDGLAIVRSQDNYVVQWGDPEAGADGKTKSLGSARATLSAEFDRAVAGLPFTKLADGDIYAPEAGWSGGFPAARDAKAGRAWLAHCYAMVGAGRGMEPESSGAELYVVIGHSPRHLDRNITLVGRVVQGMEHLSTLPRGTGPLGFYEQAEQRVPIKAIRLAATVPEAERVPLQVFRTDTPAFEQLIEARRHRREDWFLDPVGHVELCNVPIPVRAAAAP